MNPKFVTVIASLLLGPCLAHAQTITGVSGTFSNGGVVTITGSSFGTKSTAAPIKWDNFESGTNGRAITTADGWNSVDGWDGSSHSHPPAYISSVKHAGNLGMTCPFIGGTYNSSVLKVANFSAGFYLDAWYQYAPASPASRNYKLFDLFGTGTNELPVAAMTGSCKLNESIWVPFYAGPNDGDAEYTGLTFNHLIGQMRHIQVWLKPSTPGVRDGRVWVAVDGVVHADASDKLTVMPGVGTWKEVRIGYYYSHELLGDCPPSGDARVYWDDLYLDNTPARVEIGNAPTYASSTHREIQIPTSWSNGQISISANLGTFQAGNAMYLYVVNSNGQVSPGYSLGGSGTPTATPTLDTLAPAPPTNLATH